MLALGAPETETAVRSVDGVGMVGGVAPGDWVSLHWEWVCDRLSEPRWAGCGGTPSGTWRSSTTGRRVRSVPAAARLSESRPPSGQTRRASSLHVADRACRGGPGSRTSTSPRGLHQVVGVRPPEPDRAQPALQRSAEAGPPGAHQQPARPVRSVDHRGRAGEPGGQQVGRAGRRPAAGCRPGPAPRRAAAPPGRRGRAPPRRRAWRRRRPPRCPAAGPPAPRGTRRGRGCRGGRSARRTGRARPPGQRPGQADPLLLPAGQLGRPPVGQVGDPQPVRAAPAPRRGPARGPVPRRRAG